MQEKELQKETFVVQVLHTQNATWQGTVTWTDTHRTETFRSALELIRLMDSALLEATAEGSRGFLERKPGKEL